MSTITAAGEFAYLIPGHSKAIGKAGNSYIDDFEGSQSEIALHSQSAWSLASTPQGQTASGMFPEGALSDDIINGYNRAKLFDISAYEILLGVIPGCWRINKGSM